MSTNVLPSPFRSRALWLMMSESGYEIMLCMKVRGNRRASPRCHGERHLCLGHSELAAEPNDNAGAYDS
ncbi:hypothetical protein FA13DRAFT_1732174 [Coprinellus micaceus]|jgi:hypothetical protein|uniref:Uncharacterized protein n=1 Tax=Coprinellus micaceus TaxID=71717 RepID=A0A4Y7TCY3_COPMI|nr:hypothetical protein FA13DRAFT_1732174 [Coprinellus micaceus]